MKMTIVIDTEDPRGVEDSFKIVSHFYKRQRNNARYTSTEVKYGKIAFIKMLRKFARHARESEGAGLDSAGLRFTKEYADEIFGELGSL